MVAFITTTSNDRTDAVLRVEAISCESPDSEFCSTEDVFESDSTGAVTGREACVTPNCVTDSAGITTATVQCKRQSDAIGNLL